jgi:hypothetical protein
VQFDYGAVTGLGTLFALSESTEAG